MKEMKDQLTASFSGKYVEPVPKGELNKIGLLKTLSWYSQHGESDKLKAYAIAYISKNFNKDMATTISKLPDYDFKTYGALCRMQQRGFELDQHTIGRIKEYFDRLHVKAKTLFEVKATIVKTEKVIDKFPPMPKSIELIEQGLDKITDGGASSFAKPTEDKTSGTIIKAFCDKEIKQIQDDTLAGDIPKKLCTKYIKFLESVITNLAAQKASKPRVVKRISPLKIVQTVKHNIEALGVLKPLSPIDVLNKKKMYVYDKKTRKIMVFIATGTGFSFKGTTLQYFDIAKSGMKTVRKPEETFAQTQSMSTLNKVYSEIKYPESKPTGRFNDKMVIICVS